MSIKKLFLLATALYTSQHNESLSAMDTLPAEVQNLIFSLISMRSQLNFMQTAHQYKDLMPTSCSSCTINTKNKVDKDGKEICIDLEKIGTKIDKISIIGSLAFKGQTWPALTPSFGIFLSNQNLITDLQLFDFDISSKHMTYLTPFVGHNTIKTLTIAQEHLQTQRIYIDIHYMTFLLNQMPHLDRCVLSHVALHCGDEHTGDKFMNLGEQLFRVQQLEIHNASVGYYDSLDWIVVALRDSKTIKKLTLNNIYTTDNSDFEEDNYTEPLTSSDQGTKRIINEVIKHSTLQYFILNGQTIYDPTPL